MFLISFIMMIVSFGIFVIVCNINMEEKFQEKIKSILFIILGKKTPASKRSVGGR